MNSFKTNDKTGLVYKLQAEGICKRAQREMTIWEVKMYNDN